MKTLEFLELLAYRSRAMVACLLHYTNNPQGHNGDYVVMTDANENWSETDYNKKFLLKVFALFVQGAYIHLL